MDKETQARARNLYRIAGVVAVLMAALTISGLVRGTNLYAILAWVALGIAAGAAIILARRNRIELGAGIMLAVALTFLPTSALNSQGAGILTAMIALVLATVIGYLALTPRWRIWAFAAGGVSATASLLLDVFGSPNRPQPLDITFSIVIAGAILGAYALFLLRQFSRFSLREKFVVISLALTLLPLAVLAVVNNRASSEIIVARTGAALKNLAETQARNVAALLEQETNLLTVLAFDSALQAAVQEANADYNGDAQANEAELEKRDQQWRAADAANNDADELVASRLNNPAAQVLQRFRAAYPAHVEVFLTDKYGGNVAATNRTSDFYQADEEWWQKAYDNGLGAVYIGQPEFDASAQTNAVNIAVPVFGADGKTIEGVLRTTFSIQAIVALLESVKPGESGHMQILLPNNQTIGYADAGIHDAVTLARVRNMQGDTIEIANSGAPPRFYSAAPVLQDKIAGPVAATVSNLGWLVLIHQNHSEALAPIGAQTRNTIFLALVIAGVAAAVAIGGARYLTRPLLGLTTMAEQVRVGNLQARVPVESSDEIGTLATTFNAMTAEMSELVGNLEQRVADRTQVLESNNAYYLSLQNVSVELMQRRDLQSLLQDIIERAGELVGTKNGYVFLLDPETEEMVMRVGVGTYQEIVGTKAKRGTGLAGQVWQTGQALAVDDYRTWSGRLAGASRDVLRAVVGVPIKSDETTIGIIGLSHLEADKHFGPVELDVLNRFASLASIALDNARLLEASQRELQQRERTEQFLDSILENLPTMLFVKEASTLRFVRWNRAGEQITGTARQEFLGKSDYDFFPPDEADFFVAKDRETLATGQTLDIVEEPIKTASGEIRWLHTRKVPILDAQGKPLYLLGISEDITARKQADEALRASEARLRAIMDSANDAVVVADANGIILEWNHGAEKIFQYTETEVLGQALTLLMPEKYRHAHEAGIERVRGGGEKHILGKTVELSGLRKDGAEFPLELSLSQWTIGDQVFFSGILRDVTERRRAQEQANIQSAALDSAANVIVITDVSGKIQWANRAFTQVSGYSLEDAAGKTPRLLKSGIHDGAFYKNLWDTILAGNVWSGEITNRRKDGELYHEQMTITPIRDVDGEIYRFVAIKQDITERKRAQEREQFQNALLGAQSELSPDGILVVGADDRILAANARFAEMWDFTPEMVVTSSMETLRQRALQSVADPEGWLRDSSNIYAHPDQQSRAQVLFKDGRIFEEYSAPVTAPDGSYLARVWYFHDLTQIKRTQQEIGRIIETAAAIFWRATVTDLQDPALEAAGFHWETSVPNFESLTRQIPLHREPEYSDSDSWYQSWLTEDREAMNKTSAAALREGRSGYEQEFRLRDANGEIHWLMEEAHIQRLDADHFEVVGVTMDITRRKRAELELRENEALYQSLVQTIPQALTRKDREGRVTFGNARFFEDTLLTPQDVYGKTDFDFHPRELADKYWQDDLRVLRDGETIDAIEPHQRGDGTMITVHVLKTPLRNEAGEIEGMQIMFWDITEEQQRQQQLHQQNAYLNVLQETSLGLIGRLEVNALLQDIVTRAGQLVGTENGYVFIKEPGAEEMELRVGVGAYEGFVGRRTKIGVGLAGQVWDNNEPVVVADYREYGGRLADASRDILRAVVGVPLRSGSEVIGVIGLAYLDPALKFGPQELSVLERFAQLAAIALDNARLYEQAQSSLRGEQHQRHLADALARAGARLSGTLQEAAMRQIILDEINALLKPDQINFYARVDDAASLKLDARLFETADKTFGAYTTGDVILAQARPDLWQVYSEAKASYTQSAASGDLLREQFILPWFVGDNAAGVIEIYHTARHVVIRPDEQTACQGILQQASITIQNARLFVQTRQEIAERTRAEQHMAAQAERMRSLLDVSLSLGKPGVDLQALYELICEQTMLLLDADGAGIWIPVSADELELQVNYNVGETELTGRRLKRGEGLSGRVFETGEAIRVDDYLAWAGHSVVFQDAPFHAVLSLPMTWQGEMVGVLAMTHSQMGKCFSDQDVQFGKLLAAQAGAALVNARLYANVEQELEQRTLAETRARQRNLELESINRVAVAMMADVAIEDSLRAMAQELVYTFRARNCGIALLNPQGTELTVVADALAEEHEEHAVGIVIPVSGNPSSEYVIQNKKSLVIFDAQHDPMTAPIHERMRERRTTCLAIVPLLSGDKVIGTIGLDTTEQGRIFTQDDIRVAETMATQMASALEKQRLFQQTEASANRLAALNRIAHAVTTPTGFDELAQAIYHEVNALLKPDAFFMALYAPEERMLDFRVQIDRGIAYPPDRTPMGETLSGRVIDSGTSLLIPDMQKTDDPDAGITFGSADAVRTWLGVPLHGGDKMIGVLSIQSYMPDAFGTVELDLLQTIADQVGVAVERARLFDETETRARETEIINEMARALSGQVESENIFSIVYQYLPLLMATDAFIVWLYDTAHDTVTRPALYDRGELFRDEEAPRAPGGNVARVLASGEPIVINHTRSEWDQERQNVSAIIGTDEPSASLSYVPLRAGNELRGVISAQTYQFNAYGAPQVALLTGVANHIVSALDNARLFAETEDALAEARRLYELGSALNQVTTLQDLVRVAAQPAFERGAGSTQLLLLTYGADNQPLTGDIVVNLLANGEPVVPHYAHFPIEQFSIGKLILSVPNELFYIEDLAASPVPDDATRTMLRESKINAVAFLRLVVEQRVLGVIMFGWEQAHFFSDAEQRLYRSLASQLALALNNRLLFEQTEQALAESRTLYEISARLNAANSMQEALEAASGPAVVQGASNASLMRIHTDAFGKPDELELVASWPRQQEASGMPLGTRLPVSFFATANSWIENPSEPRVFADLLNDPAFPEQVREWIAQTETRASATLPLKVGERWIGLLTFNWNTTHAFTDKDLRLYRSIMAQAATVLDNRSLFEQTQVALAQTQHALTQVQDTERRINLQYQTAQLLAGAVSFEAVASQLLEKTCRALDWQIGEYWALSPDGTSLTLREGWNAGTAALQSFALNSKGLTFPYGEGFVGKTLVAHEPIWSENILTDPGFKQTSGAAEAGLVCAFGFPLLSEQRVFGAAIFFSNHAQTLDEPMIATLTGVGNQIVQYLQRRQAEESVRQHNTYLTALHDTTLGLVSRLDLQELLQNIITRAAELVGTEHGYVHLVEPSGKELQMRVGVGIYHEFIGTRVKPGQGLAGTVWQTGQAINVDDYRAWSGRLPMVDRDVLRAVVGVPLKSGDETVGVLGLASLEPERVFSSEQMQAIEQFAELAAVALDNAQLYEKSQSALQKTQRAADREKTIAEITDRLYVAPDLRTVLQTAAEELRRSTGSKRAVVRLKLAPNGEAKPNGDES